MPHKGPSLFLVDMDVHVVIHVHAGPHVRLMHSPSLLAGCIAHCTGVHAGLPRARTHTSLTDCWLVYNTASS